MAILQSNGIIIVSAIPVHSSVDNQAVLAWDNTNYLMYYYDGAVWQTIGWSLSDGDKGDIVVSAGGTVYTIDTGVVTFAKMQTISTDKLLGRDTAGTGAPEQLSVSGGIEFTGSGGIQSSAFTGDVTKASGGTSTTIANDSVTYAKMQNIVTDSLIGRDTAGTGDPEAITLNSTLEFTGAGAIQRAAISGDISMSAGSNSALIPNDTVTYAKMQNVSATDKVLGRSTAGSGDVEEIPFTAQARALNDDTSFSAMRTTLGLAIGTDVEAHDTTLTALAAYNTNGLLTQTAADTFVGRTLTGTANEITVSQGNGVAGNPTFSLPTGIDPAKLADGTVSATEFQYINSVTSNVQTQINNILALIPSKIYSAKISQATTANCSAVIAVNNLGETPSFTRNNAGDYEIGVVGTQFTLNKTIVQATLNVGATAVFVEASWNATNKIVFKTYDITHTLADLQGSLDITVIVSA